MTINDPRVIIPASQLSSSNPLFLILGFLFPTHTRRGKDKLGRIEEIAYALWTVGYEGEDLGDEGLLDQWWDQGKELGETGFACGVSYERRLGPLYLP
jgi:hypothetical protein